MSRQIHVRGTQSYFRVSGDRVEDSGVKKNVVRLETLRQEEAIQFAQMAFRSEGVVLTIEEIPR